MPSYSGHALYSISAICIHMHNSSRWRACSAAYGVHVSTWAAARSRWSACCSRRSRSRSHSLRRLWARRAARDAHPTQHARRPRLYRAIAISPCLVTFLATPVFLKAHRRHASAHKLYRLLYEHTGIGSRRRMRR